MPAPVVPVVPDKASQLTRKKKILLYEADDGTRQTRQKRAAKVTYEMTHERRKKSEFDSMKTFWNTNYPGVQVQVTHPYTGEVLTGWIDSDLKEQWHMVNLVSFSWVFQEA